MFEPMKTKYLKEVELTMLRKLALAVLLMAVIVPISPSHAEEAQNSELVKLLNNVNVGFYLDTGYEFNFNQPKSGENQFRSLDPQDNEFEIHAAQLSFEKLPSIEKSVADYVGFRIDLLFGEDANRVSAAGLSSDTVDLTQAYINVLAPIGNGLNIYAGKFVTLAGFEVIESKGNPNITRSFLFGLAIPFTHTGVRLSYPTGPLTFTVGLNNGWDVVDDNNDGKTIESQVALDLGIASFYLTGYFGPEQDGVDGDYRELITFVGTGNLTDLITVSFDLDLGWEQGVGQSVGGEKDVFWRGVAGYVTYEFNPAVSLTVRGEVFKDGDGSRTGFNQRLWEFTPTLSIKPFQDNKNNLGNLEFRAEYRHDQSDKDVFENDNGGLEDTQDTIALQLLYSFSED